MAYSETKSSGRKKFDQEKAKKIEENKKQIQPIDQKLSHYQREYRAGNIVLVNDADLGYSLGRIVFNDDEDELILSQKYRKFRPEQVQQAHGFEKMMHDSASFNHIWLKCSEEKPIANLISVLNPSTELSLDDLRSLEDKTPLYYNDNEYGFMGNKTDDGFILYIDRALKFPRERCTFQQMQDVAPRILVPEIKLRIV